MALDPEMQRRAEHIRRRYEWQRVGLALVGILPMILVVVLACMHSQRVATSVLFGSAALVTSAAMLWRGRDAQRAFFPGLLAGAVPLVLGLWAHQAHGCCVSGGACMAGMSSMCLPACSAGGVAAGLLVALIGRRWKVGGSFWISAAATTMLIGAMGCACVGYTGVLGLAAGYIIGLLPMMHWRR